MGRMIDILRTADRRPAADPQPAVQPPDHDDIDEVDDEPSIPDTEIESDLGPPIEDDNDVPFIEVGAGREPNLRIMAPPSPGFAGEAPEVRVFVGPESPEPSPAIPLPLSRERGDEPSLFTIRFQPVHAARLGGRCPVAELIAFHEPDHAVSVQYRSLATEIARQLPGTLPRILLFTGAGDGVGTSTVILNLAITLARQDAKVTVIDAHLARPSLAARLGLPAGPGLREVLSGQMPPAWVLQETAHPNLHMLPAGVAGTTRAGTDLGAILELLRDRSDCVLADAGPWGDGAIAAELAAGSDAVYLVMREEALATPGAVKLQEDVLERTGRLRGCVLTQR
jgi:Mrp family chromosome partitioning ATPase